MIQSYLSSTAAGSARASRLALLTVLTTVVAGTLALLAPQPASAFIVTSHGNPGRVGVPPATLGYGDLGGVTEELRAPARYIYESPVYAGRDQYVCIKHRTWELDGNTWILQDVQRRCYWIRAAYTRIVDGAYISNYRPMIMTWIAYDVVVSWRLPNGVAIGSKAVRYEVGDGYNMDLRCANGYLAPDCMARSDDDVIALT